MQAKKKPYWPSPGQVILKGLTVIHHCILITMTQSSEMNQSKVVFSNCIPASHPYCTSGQSLILRESQRLVWVFNRLRCIINVIIERNIAPGSDVVLDNTGKYCVACSLWFRSQVVKAGKAPLKNSIYTLNCTACVAMSSVEAWYTIPLVVLELSV